jgi:hypothetical protein
VEAVARKRPELLDRHGAATFGQASDEAEDFLPDHGLAALRVRARLYLSDGPLAGIEIGVGDAIDKGNQLLPRFLIRRRRLVLTSSLSMPAQRPRG